MELFLLVGCLELELSFSRIMKKVFDVPGLAKSEYGVRFLDVLVQLLSHCSIESNLFIFAMAKNLVQSNCLETGKGLGQLLPVFFILFLLLK